MKPALVRVALYSLVALALAGALRFTPTLPEPERKAAEVLVAQAATPSWKLRFDTLGRGESLQSLLRARRAERRATPRARCRRRSASLDERRIPAGMPVTIRIRADRLDAVRGHAAALDRSLAASPRDRVTRGPAPKSASRGRPTRSSSAERSRRICTTRWTRARKNDLPARRAAAARLVARRRLRVSRRHEPRSPGGRRIQASSPSARWRPTGAVRIGQRDRGDVQAVGQRSSTPFASRAIPSSGEFFDQNGKSMRAAFLRAPLEFRRISSVFGGREHPDPRRLARAQGNRLRRGDGNAGARDRRRRRRPRRLGQRLRQHARDPPSQRLRHALRTPEPVRFRHPRGIARDDRPDRGVRREHRARHRTAPALRGARRRTSSATRASRSSRSGASRYPSRSAPRSSKREIALLAYLDSPAPGVAKLALR